MIRRHTSSIYHNVLEHLGQQHYIDVIMTTMASQITSLMVVYSIVCSDADQRKHQSSAAPAFVWGIHRDRWIPRTNGQLRGKCFHLMTSSWNKTHLFGRRCMKTSVSQSEDISGDIPVKLIWWLHKNVPYSQPAWYATLCNLLGPLLLTSIKCHLKPFLFSK